MKDEPAAMTDLLKLAERPWTTSTREEVIGILWAILACITHSKILASFAGAMAAFSLAAALYFTVKEGGLFSRARASMEKSDG